MATIVQANITEFTRATAAQASLSARYDAIGNIGAKQQNTCVQLIKRAEINAEVVG